MLDAVVVGGGPAGSASARLLASKGYGVKVLEEHSCSGRPVQCAGLFSDEVIRMSGVSPDVLNTLYGAEVVFPDGRTVKVRSPSPMMYSVDRAEMDSLMAGAAIDAGAEYSYSDRRTSHSVGSDGVIVKSSSGEVSSRSIIGADGHTSGVAASLGGNGPKEYLRGIQADVKASFDLDGLFRARLGSRYAPGFFTWEFSCGDFVRVGLCTSWSAGPPHQYLKKMLDDLYPGCERLATYSGKIPLGMREHICGDRCMLVGDAAGQVKPVSGGGLYPSLLAAPILADVLSSALEKDDLSFNALRPYEKLCRKTIGKDLKRGYFMRRLYVRLDDDDLSRAGRYCSRDDINTVLNETNVDCPADVFKKVITMPSAIPGALSIFLRCIL